MTETAPLRTPDEATGWLEGLINLERQREWAYARLSLAPIEALLDRLSHPEAGLSVVHIAGSKGKGSTALLTEAILRAAGRRVGTFTSPHLERFTERFRIDGAEVAPERLVDVVERIRPEVEVLRSRASAEIPAPSFFDAITAVAWCLFAEAGVDHAVMEVGLGGRLDSTNAVLPDVACITSIELEHTDKLGDTLGAIAAEKAGILKPEVPAVLGPLPDEAMRVVEARAAQLSAPLFRVGREIGLLAEAGGVDGVKLRISDGPLEVETLLPLPGSHQPANAALAVACACRALGDAVGTDLASRAARLALGRAQLPGRLEILRRRPWILVDAAHTPASAASLAEVLALLGGGAQLVASISSDKDATAVLEILLPMASRVTLTRAEPLRSQDPEQLARTAHRLSPDLPSSVVADPEQALRLAARDLAEGDVLCAVGSVYLAGIARRVLSRDSLVGS